MSSNFVLPELIQGKEASPGGVRSGLWTLVKDAKFTFRALSSLVMSWFTSAYYIVKL